MTAATEAANHRRWPPDARGRYEVWYTTWNHPGTGQGFWLRFITEAPLEGPPRGELWFARFDPARPERTFGIHRRFADVTSSTGPFALHIGGARLGHDHSAGQLAGDGHDVRWELRWQPAAHVLRLLPPIMYTGGGRGETTVQSPNPRVPLSGTLVVDGEPLAFDGAVAGQTHLWGTKHAFAWTWGRCAELDGAPDAVLELLAVKLQRRGVTLPTMAMVALDLDGEHHRLTGFRNVLVNRARWRTGHVEVSARSARLRIDVDLACTADQLVTAPYLDPDGTEVFCANTEIGDARVTIFRRAGLGWKEERRLVGTRRAHFETGGREPDARVTRIHTLVE